MPPKLTLQLPAPFVSTDAAMGQQPRQQQDDRQAQLNSSAVMVRSTGICAPPGEGWDPPIAACLCPGLAAFGWSGWHYRAQLVLDPLLVHRGGNGQRRRGVHQGERAFCAVFCKPILQAHFASPLCCSTQISEKDTKVIKRLGAGASSTVGRFSQARKPLLTACQAACSCAGSQVVCCQVQAGIGVLGSVGSSDAGTCSGSARVGITQHTTSMGSGSARRCSKLF